MKRLNQKGSMIVIVLLILLLALGLISAAIYSVALLGQSQSNNSTSEKEHMSIFSLVNTLDNQILTGAKSNFRGDVNYVYNGKTSGGKAYIGQLTNNADKTYLMLDMYMIDRGGKRPLYKKGFKPLPLFNYTHFVIDPADDLGDISVREEDNGIVRANKIDNLFTNMTGVATKENGQPYIMMQEIDISEYEDTVYNYGIPVISNNSDLSLYFANNQTLYVDPLGLSYPIAQNSLIVVKNNGNAVKLLGGTVPGNPGGRYGDIILNNSITLVTDSPVYLDAGVPGPQSMLIISTYSDANVAAVNFDINQYIAYKLYPYQDDPTLYDTNSIFFGWVNAIRVNKIPLQAVIFTPNSTFGYIQKTYVDPFYNVNTANQLVITGGIIEQNSRYDLKQFDFNLPIIYPHLICQRDVSFLTVLDAQLFPFVNPPLAKNIFVFDSKYF